MQGLRNEPSIFEAADVRINAANPLVYHFHGHVNELNSMVVTEDDYLDFLANLAEDKKLIPAADPANPGPIVALVHGLPGVRLGLPGACSAAWPLYQAVGAGEEGQRGRAARAPG